MSSGPEMGGYAVRYGEASEENLGTMSMTIRHRNGIQNSTVASTIIQSSVLILARTIRRDVNLRPTATMAIQMPDTFTAIIPLTLLG